MGEPLQVDHVRQLGQHLESLKSAGVSWLPAAVAVAANTELAPPEVTMPAKIEGIGISSLFDGQTDTAVTSPEERRLALENVCARVGKCSRCAELASSRRNTVFGVGRIGPEICFVGEAPGADEDVQGEPFVGAAGQLLNKIIAACGMKREDVYICNIIKCRPPGNRLPLPSEAANCREFLEEQLELVKPRFICALGACAAQNLLNTTTAIGRLRGQFHQYKGIPVLCTYHPAYLLRSPDKKRDVWEDMKKLLERMGRPLP
jgi:uracil-DNA glycosylase